MKSNDVMETHRGYLSDKHHRAPTCLQVGDETVVNTKTIANSLNAYLASIPKQYIKSHKSNLDLDTAGAINDFVHNRVLQGVDFTVPPITTEFVQKNFNQYQVQRQQA